MNNPIIVWAEQNLAPETLENLHRRHDDEELAVLMEQIVPLPVLYADEFQRYYDLFIKYFPKTPCHVKRQYDQGFLCIKGRKKNGEQYNLGCYPDLVAKMLDHERWKTIHPDKPHQEGCWIALREPRKSRMNVIDFDNKHHLLGYYRRGLVEQGSPLRPLMTMPLDHFKSIKRIYDEFPHRIWCVSSATLGLHVWEIRPQLQGLLTIQINTKTRLRKIGLGNTEVHPMPGRAFRRPFGEDYYTITNNGLLGNWIEQLNFFEHCHTPTFENIFNVLRSLLSQELGHYQHYSGHCEVRRIAFKDVLRLEGDLKQLDEWAGQGFPDVPPVAEPIIIDLSSELERTHPAPAGRDALVSCEIDMTKVCNGEWIQHCELWARHGLPCHDSVFLVCSQLARWLYYIELHHLPHEERLQRIIDLLTTYCKKKNNSFISRWDAGMKRAVIGHIQRAIDSGVNHADDIMVFTKIRQRRDKGQYKRVIYLEVLLQSEAEDSQYTSSSCCAYICCSSTEAKPEVNNVPVPAHPEIEEKRKKAEAWQFKPDYTPIPVIESAIREFYRDHGLRTYQVTMQKLIALINHLAARGGEARLGVESLAKMGFCGYESRKHIERLEQAGVIDTFDDYCPAAGRSRRFKLTKRAMAVIAESRAVKTA